MAKKQKPSVDNILALYDDCKARYEETGLYRQFDLDDQLYELDFKSQLGLPKEFANQGIVLPTARDIVDTCVDHTDIFNARVYVNKKGESIKSEDEQNLLRKFGLGVLYRNNIEASIAPIRVCAKHYWMHGLAIVKSVWDADRWIDKPTQNKGESEEAYAGRIDTWRSESHNSIPIVLQGIHPRNMMFDPYTGGMDFAFETNEELVFNVSQQFPGWKNPLGKKVSDRVVHISFWTKDYRCELYDREPVLKGSVVEHTYGFLPYTPIDSGLGNISSDNDLKKRYVGVLRYVKELLISESRDYSIGDVILGKTAFPWGYLTGPNASGVTQIFQKFGEYNTLPDGVEIHDMSPKVPPDALLTWLNVASTYLAGHGAPPSVRGMGETNVRSGSDRRQLIAEASSRYEYSNQAFKNGIAKVLSNCANILKYVVPGDVSVWARTPTDEFDIEIQKAKMNPPFTFYVEFAPINEEDEYRRHDDLERLYKSGLITANWARKQMSNIDPQAMEVEIEVEHLLQDPMVQSILSQYTAGRLMQAMTKRSQAESINDLPPTPILGDAGQSLVGQLPGGPNQPQAPGSQAPGRQLVPSNRSIVPPGGAVDLQNQMAQARSQVPMNPTQGRGGGGQR